MIVYNVTVNVDDQIHEEWVEWMRTVHIPEVLSTGLFTGHRFLRLLSRFEEETGTTYAVQYYMRTADDYEKYRNDHAPALQAKTVNKFAGGFMAFRTLLEEV